MTEENKTVQSFLGFLLDSLCFSMNKISSVFNKWLSQRMLYTERKMVPKLKGAFLGLSFSANLLIFCYFQVMNHNKWWTNFYDSYRGEYKFITLGKSRLLFLWDMDYKGKKQRKQIKGHFLKKIMVCIYNCVENKQWTPEKDNYIIK